MSTTETIAREDCELVLSCGIRTQRDLAAILPIQIREKVTPYLLGQPRTRAALRLLARVDSFNWCAAVENSRIDAWQLLAALGPWRSYTARERVLVEAAAAFLEPDRFQLNLASVASRFEDDEDFLAFVDALRLTREGLPA